MARTSTVRRRKPDRGAQGETGYPAGLITLEDQCEDKPPGVRWRSWRGDREFPYPPDQLVRVRLRSGGVGKFWRPASDYQWRHRSMERGRYGWIAVKAKAGEADHPGDIVGFVLPEDFERDVDPEKLKGAEG